ncbi:CDP-diacylglycerol--serine O-phosphatidyltransferase [Tropicibacter oceani]|uniref:CDP-diacylglycerol--serine O-phosphatidyltransferase n=1 Tax=Tropicibacter oceani TaxID=3058420 RepID=A0ABY8QI49_9RHOB|nr:CDP-diacylglycerol--serine O-phosphatidyltransferase [Tropicibacter oceani]WGW03666.1 CDP-diacylglycerol--serine O-phosphatidyltransferase [Tropicibacter oceani]
MPETPPGGQPRSEAGAVSILMLLPNMVTLIGMSLGLTAIRFAIEGRFTTAVFLIILSALADGLDGLLARRLKAESPMGAQLDSLSDFLCFGVAPAILVYQVHLSHTGGFGWIFALLFAAAACLRLARFNVTSGQADESAPAKRYFVGVPAPAGALLGLMPVFLTLSGTFSAGSIPVAVCIWLTIVGGLMISRLKTPSPKALKVPRSLTAVILFATVIVIGLSFTHPWFLLAGVNVGYLMMVAYGQIRDRSTKR